MSAQAGAQGVAGTYELEDGRETVLVTVIVPARDAGPNLRELRNALLAQTLARERFEVIVGDDGSADGSTLGLASTDGWLRVVRGPAGNPAAARNRAARLARAPVLAFLDSDCRPEPGWLESGLRALQQADLVGGLVTPSVSGPPSVWTLLDLDLHVDQERAIRLGRALSGNLFLRRELFERLGAFDETLARTEDTELVRRARRLAARLAFAPAAVVRHPAHERAGPFLRKLWGTQAALGVRDARVGIRPRLATIGILPIVGMIRTRWREGRPLRVDPARLSAAGVRPSPATELCALALLYVLVPVIAHLARLSGWARGRRET